MEALESIKQRFQEVIDIRLRITEELIKKAINCGYEVVPSSIKRNLSFASGLYAYVAVTRCGRTYEGTISLETKRKCGLVFRAGPLYISHDGKRILSSRDQFLISLIK